MTTFSRLLLLLVLLVIVDSPQPVQAQEAEATAPPRPLPASTQTSAGVRMERYFAALQQGQVGVLALYGEGIQEARALFRGRETAFLPHEGAWYALLVADIDAQARDYPLSIVALRDDGSRVSFNEFVTVSSGGYLRQNFTVGGTLAYLTDPIIERNEYARLDAIIAPIAPQPLWDGDGWQVPLDAPFSSPFGNYRILNQNVQTRHTGWDMSVPPGTPVAAMAAGEVVFAGRMDIRGNYVMLHHGWGVYSGYAHLSQINVERGQTIAAGQILGASGNSGRSSGPHLHWEVAVNGEWVDGVLFLEMWLPN